MEENADASNRPWTSGLQIGTYELRREIARGGMGEIWLARQRGPADFERLVVLKRLLSSPEHNATNVEMFLDEARLCAQLQHPNIVQTLELGQAHGSYFLAMEYLVGQTLSRVTRRLLERRAGVPVHFAVEIVTASARGLGYAHRRLGLDGKPLHAVHRDVSPQNLFVTYEGQTKVLDFGVAKAAGRRSRTATGLVKGTLSYMSPEQALGLPTTATADVFSLGAVLFELVTGTRLHGESDEVAIFRRFAEGEPLPLASERQPEGLDPELDALIGKAMHINPLSRFEDGAALAQALEAWSRSHPPTAHLSLQEAMHEVFAEEIAALSKTRAVPPPPAALTVPNMPIQTGRQTAGRRVALGMAGLLGVSALGSVAWSRMGSASVHEEEADASIELVLPQSRPPSLVDAGAATPTQTNPQTIAATTVAPTTGNKPARKGLLTLETDPWANVFLGKRMLGETPLVKVALPVGVHRLRLVNEPEKLDTYIEVEIVADEVTVKKMVF